MKQKYEKILDILGLPKFLCYFCDEVVFVTRRGLNKHILKQHRRKKGEA